MSVQAQQGEPGSTLELYRSALELRRRTPQLRDPRFAWCATAPDIPGFDRGADFRCLVNLSDRTVPLPAWWRLLLSSREPADDELAPDTAVWLRRRAADHRRG